MINNFRELFFLMVFDFQGYVCMIMYVNIFYQIQLTSHRFSVSNAQKREPRPPSVDSMLLPARSQKMGEAPKSLSASVSNG